MREKNNWFSLSNVRFDHPRSEVNRRIYDPGIGIFGCSSPSIIISYHSNIYTTHALLDEIDLEWFSLYALSFWSDWRHFRQLRMQHKWWRWRGYVRKIEIGIFEDNRVNDLPGDMFQYSSNFQDDHPLKRAINIDANSQDWIIRIINTIESSRAHHCRWGTIVTDNLTTLHSNTLDCSIR